LPAHWIAAPSTVSNGNFTIAIRDTGARDSEAEQGKIFDEFKQADNSAAKK
jgi:hypothetical protein